MGRSICKVWLWRVPGFSPKTLSSVFMAQLVSALQTKISLANIFRFSRYGKIHSPEKCNEAWVMLKYVTNVEKEGVVYAAIARKVSSRPVVRHAENARRRGPIVFFFRLVFSLFYADHVQSFTCLFGVVGL